MIELSSDDIKTLVTAREILNHLATDPATGGGLALGVSSGLTILLRNVVVAEKQSVLAQGDPPESPKLIPADAKAWAGESMGPYEAYERVDQELYREAMERNKDESL